MPGVVNEIRTRLVTEGGESLKRAVADASREAKSFADNMTKAEESTRRAAAGARNVAPLAGLETGRYDAGVAAAPGVAAQPSRPEARPSIWSRLRGRGQQQAGGWGGGGGRGARSWLSSTLQQGIGMAMGQGIFSMLQESISQYREWTEIRAQMSSLMGGGNWSAVSGSINRLGKDFAYFQEEGFRAAQSLAAVQGNIGGLQRAGAVARAFGADINQLAQSYGRIARFTAGGARPGEAIDVAAFGTMGAGKAVPPGIRQEQMRATLDLMNSFIGGGYLQTPEMQTRLAGMMSYAAQNLGQPGQYAGQEGARLIGGIAQGVSGARSGMGAALFLRGALAAGKVRVGNEVLDPRNPFHLRRIQEAGFRGEGGVRIARGMFRYAQQYDRDTALELLHQTFAPAGLTYEDVSNLYGTGGDGAQFEKLFSAGTARRQVAAGRRQGLPTDWRAGYGQRFVNVGLEQSLRQAGETFTEVHNQFVKLVTSVVGARGAFDGLAKLIDGILVQAPAIRRLFLLNRSIEDPTTIPENVAAEGLSNVFRWALRRGHASGAVPGVEYGGNAPDDFSFFNNKGSGAPVQPR
ncbi:MAG: hypothetical protein WC551_12720 [Patescibacteria group bacterium]